MRVGQPFVGVRRPAGEKWGARFAFRRSPVDSFIAYERDLLDELRRAQQAAWRAGEPSLELDYREEIEAELGRVREVVDAELTQGHGHACVVEAMRASPERPSSVYELPDLDAFVEQDRRRAVPGWPARRDTGGADFGHRWRLENPFRRWETTRWRISWLCEHDEGPTNEVYAIEILDRPHPDEPRRFGRVWLLGVLPDWGAVRQALEALELNGQDERNSLIAAAQAVRAEMSKA